LLKGEISLAKIHRENLNLRVYSALKEMIADHRFKPGERINVEKMTRELGVSRTPVCEAIRRLEQEHLLVSVTNKGIFMNTLTREEALDLFAVREALEGMVAKLAAVRIDEKTLKKLDSSLEKQKKLIASGDILAYNKEDFRFHTQIHAASGNGFLVEMLERIENMIHPIGLHVSGFLPSFYEEHVSLTRALKARDPVHAAAVFRKHNETVMRVIRDGNLTYARP
jgi:DNA-binding GntR family transcriptional regulator